MKNLGRASIKIEWNENGQLNVYHGTAGAKLASKELQSQNAGDWDKLWNFLTKELGLKKHYS